MQHTDKYKFNLIETSDTFSPEALNVNAQAVEAELARVEAETLSMVGTGGYNARIAWGAYTGTGSAQTLEFDFKPVAVFLSYNRTSAMLLRGISSVAVAASFLCSLQKVSWTDNSVSFSNNFIDKDTTFYYVAIGVSLDA